MNQFTTSCRRVKLRRFYVRCHKCGAPVEQPQARNGKHEPLCALCWQPAEARRQAEISR